MIIAIAVLVSIRVALPYILRSVAASQASSALHARVEIGDVDLALWKGGVALERVAVYPLPRDEAPGIAPRTLREGTGEAGPPPRLLREGTGESLPPRVLRDGTGEVARPRIVREGTGPARIVREGTRESRGPAILDDRPLVAFERFAVELRYWPLFSKTIQLRDIALDGPRVALDRLASGDLNIMALVPQSDVEVEAGASPTPADAEAEPATTWKFGLDRFVLRDGRLRFRDFTLAGSEPIEVGIDTVTVQEIALSPGVYGEPARVDLTLGLDEGEIGVAARFELIEAGMSVTCDVKAQRLPLRRARLYVPAVGWSDLQGELDLALTYTLQSETTNQLRGTLALRDVAVAVPQLEEVALGWKSLEVGIDDIDLLAQRAAIASVALTGADLYVRAQGDEPLPLLARPAPAGATAAPTPAPTPVGAAAPPPAEPAKPWEWSVAKLRLDDSTVHVLSDQPTFDIDVKLDAADLAGAEDAIAHLTLALGLGAATVNMDGDLRIAATPAFGGTLKIADLSVPPLLAVSGAVDPALLPSATLTTDLAIEAGLPASGGGAPPPDVLRVSGSVGLRDVRVVPPGADLGVETGALDLAIERLTVPGVIPAGQQAPPAAAVALAAKLGLRDTRLTMTGEQPLQVAIAATDLQLTDVAVPAALAGLAPADAPQPLRAALQLDLTAPQVTLDASAMSAGAGSIRLAVPELALVALPPNADPAGAPPARLVAQLDVDGLALATAEGRDMAVDVERIGLQLSELTLPGVTAAGPPAAGVGPLHAVAQLDVGESKVTIAEGKALDGGVQSIALRLSELTLPGVFGAAAGDPPLRAAATLTVAQPRAVRGDGKEFSFKAKSIAVPLGELVVAAAPAAGGAQAIQATFGDVRIDAPSARLTRTKDGLVLPSGPPPAQPDAVPAADAAPPAADAATPSPAATPAPAAAGGTPPLQVSIASLRISKGDLDFTDRAVEPAFHDRYSPITLDARGLRFPNPTVKPLKLDVTSAEQGRITATGEFGPQGGNLDLVVDKFPLTPFNPYARTYSPYGIGEGALTIKTTARLRGEKYDVDNAITLHQLELTGVEGDSLFEQQFGIPLTMALALLRDTSGDIDLNVPVEVDQSGGAAVDVVAVVRGALRQALLGAIQSPLKLVGGVIGAGGKGGGIAPAPIAFPLGRATPTASGVEGAERLATFLAGRPAMAAQLDAEVTPADVRWLHEQTLRGQWAEEGFFQRSLAFVTARGPRERIGSYLAARAEGEQAELSAEDAATLEEWLAEQAPPSEAQLRALAEERVAAVSAILREKGIDASRIAGGEPSPPPAEAGSDAPGSAPVVKITFRAMDEPDEATEAPATGTD